MTELNEQVMVKLAEISGPPLPERGWFRRTGAAFLVAAAGGSLVFEQSPANEALRVNIGLDVLESTQSSVAVGATIAAVTAGIEMGSSTLITLGLHSEGGAVTKLKDKIRKKNQDIDPEYNTEDMTKPDKTVSKVANAAANVGIALGLGAGLVTVKEHMRDPEPSMSKDFATSAKATGIVAAVSGGIGYLAAGGISHAEGTFAERPAEMFVDYGTDTKFWMGALAAGYGLSLANKLRKRIFGERSDNDDHQTGSFDAHTGNSLSTQEIPIVENNEIEAKK